MKEINRNRILVGVTVLLTDHLEIYRKTPYICRLSVTSVSVQWLYADIRVKFAKLSTWGKLKTAF